MFRDALKKKKIKMLINKNARLSGWPFFFHDCHVHFFTRGS